MLMRGQVLLVLLISMLLLCSACAQQEPYYALPPTQEEVEQLLAEYNLNWQVDYVSPATEGQMLFSLGNDNNDPTSRSALSCVSVDGQQSVSISLMLPDGYSKEQSLQFFEQEWPSWCKLAAAFYGNGREAAKVYKEFTAFAQDKDIAVDQRVHWNKQVGENNYRLNMYELNNSEQYRVYSVSIMNTPAYRRNVLNGMLINMLNVAQDGLPPIDTVFVMPAGGDQTEYNPIEKRLQKVYGASFTEQAYNTFVDSELPWRWFDAQMYIDVFDLELDVSANIHDTDQKNFRLIAQYGPDKATVYGYVRFSKYNQISDFAITDDSELAALLE